MEDPNMFNLEDELVKWRQAMAAAGLRTPALMNELEEHLREEVERQARLGISASDAFHSACERLGQPSVLREEFDIVSKSGIGAILQRRIWKLLLCSAAGILAALLFHVLGPAPYMSEAKLLIRYIIQQDPSGQAVTTTAPNPGVNAIIHDEVVLLTSSELAEQVARQIGPKKILSKAGGGDDLARAAALISTGLTVSTQPQSSVIHIAFRHPDSAILQPVLREVIAQYLRMHAGKARAAGNEPFGVGKISNIASVKAPSPPLLDTAASYGPLASIAGAGVAAGFIWVFVAGWYSNLLERRRRGMG
jgi:uncharacterized protein involved in exopolysaccharide biosynthesis